MESQNISRTDKGGLLYSVTAALGNEYRGQLVKMARKRKSKMTSDEPGLGHCVHASTVNCADRCRKHRRGAARLGQDMSKEFTV